jgi:hypothetical protein
MRINTNLKTLTHKEIRHIVDKTIGFCEVKFGVNKRKGYSKVIVKTQSKNDDFLKYGEYHPDTHTIIVFKNNCKNVSDLITTTLHEYTHTLQPVASKYYRMLKKYGYQNHPMEIEAVENEKYCNRGVEDRCEIKSCPEIDSKRRRLISVERRDARVHTKDR